MSDILIEHLNGQDTVTVAAPAPAAVAVTTAAAQATAAAEPARPNVRNRPDWVHVRLTAAAQALLGASPSVHVANGFMQYRFEGAASVPVLRAGEWTKILATETIAGADGASHPMFEIVPEASVPAVS